LPLWIKTLISACLITAIASLSRQYPGLGGLLASLPLVSVLGMCWLWGDTRDPKLLATHAEATFWFVLPSLPMFLLIPALLRHGVGFWPALAAGIALTMALYTLMGWLLRHWHITV
jgi:hypothetical protein